MNYSLPLRNAFDQQAPDSETLPDARVETFRTEAVIISGSVALDGHTAPQPGTAPGWPRLTGMFNTIRARGFGRISDDHPALRLLALCMSKLSVRWANISRRDSSLLLLLDVVLAVLSLLVANLLRFGTAFGPEQVAMLANSAPLFAVICAGVFPASGMYTTHWRYPTLTDLLRIPRAVLAASILFVGISFFVTRLEGFSRLAVVIEVFVLVAALGAVRLAFRADELQSGARRAARSADARRAVVPVLLVGSSNAADHFIRALHSDPDNTFEPIGLLDDDRSRWGMTVRGVPVVGALRDAENILARFAARNVRPRQIIFTEPLSLFGEGDATALIEFADRLGLEVARLPRSTELRDPRTQGRFDLRPIELTDLLERPQAALDRAAVERLIGGRRVLVTGAGGSIGCELALQLAALSPTELILVDNCEFNLYKVDLELIEKFGDCVRTCVLCDVRDAVRVDALFARYRPQLVFHAAALKHVPIVELNPAEGVLTNVIGSRNVANAARREQALAMVQVSTDKAVNTTNVMGATKRIAELYCQALDISGQAESVPGTRFMTVRFGNVLGSSGSLIPLFKRQLAQGGPLTVTDPEMRRFFMTIREAVELTLQASANGLEADIGQGEIFVLDMGEPIRIVDIARRMIRLAGLIPDKDVPIKFVGPRPGEKLSEELFDSSETLAESRIPGVIRAVPKPVPLERLLRGIAALERAAQSSDVDGIFAILSEFIEGYEPSAETRAAVARQEPVVAAARRVVDPVAAE